MTLSYESEIKIQRVAAREVLDSRGFPTVEVELVIDDPKHPGDSLTGRAIVPSGASTGEGEALELRDGDLKRYHGKGVLKAVENVKSKIAPAITGRTFSRQPLFDDLLRELDGSPNKAVLGANAILPVSMAFTRAQAAAKRTPTYQLIAALCQTQGVTLPVPLMNILNGGKHADNGLDIQEFMIVPAGFKTFREALRAGAEVFHQLKKILKGKGLSTGVGDEGGFAPHFSGAAAHEQVLVAIMQAIEDVGYKPGRDIYLALDCASSEFLDPATKGSTDCGYIFEGRKVSSADLIALYGQWRESYPIISIEDGLAEHDWAGWVKMTTDLGSRLQLVGDDIFVTNPQFVKKGIEMHAANAVLIKLNQIGTVTETLETIKMAAAAGYRSITSHRSGESEDTFIADLAVGTDCGQIKTGSASRTDRLAKYNQLLRIEEQLGSAAVFAGQNAFQVFAAGK